MPTDWEQLRREVAEIKRRQQELKREAARPAAPVRRAAPPTPPLRPPVRKEPRPEPRERVRRARPKRRRRAAAPVAEALDAVTPFRAWQERAIPRAMPPPFRAWQERAVPTWARGVGRRAPLRKPDRPFESVYRPFDEFGEQVPWWQPSWIPQLTGAPPMRNIDIWNYLMENPRRVRRQFVEEMQRRF